MAKRPLVAATIRTEFGDVLDDPSFRDPSSVHDLVWVPGFSDMRAERDLEIAAVASGQKKAHEAKILPLPVNVAWVRRSSPRGMPDGRSQVESANAGYRVVHKDMVGKHDWLTALPPGATIEADGSISKGDVSLMVCDGKTAGRNAARKAALTRRMTDDAGAAAGGLLDVGARTAGADPYIRKEA